MGSGSTRSCCCLCWHSSEPKFCGARPSASFRARSRRTRPNRRPMRRQSIAVRLSVLAAALVLASLATGCGGDDDSGSASATADWVDGFCGALTTWKGTLQSVGSSLRDVDQLSKAKIDEAAEDVSNANTTLSDNVRALGSPPETAAPEAKDAVDDLRGKLETSANEIEDATKDISTPTNVLQAVNTTSAVLLTMSSDISTTLAPLESIDAADEWKQAFADSESCESLGKD